MTIQTISKRTDIDMWHRTQPVTIKDGLSYAFPLRQGVPQGSCLGPLLFTVYTSKLFDIVSKHLPSVHCYADDTQLYLAFSPDVQVEDEAALNSMRDCIHDLRNWMIEDRLMLNDDKTEMMLTGTPGGALGYFWVGMCRPVLQIGTPF